MIMTHYYHIGCYYISRLVIRDGRGGGGGGGKKQGVTGNQTYRSLT